MIASRCQAGHHLTQRAAQARSRPHCCSPGGAAVFLFLYFLFLFFTKIYFRFQNLQEYTPTAPLPGGRDLVAPLRGGRGFCAKTFAKIFARRSLGAGRPAAGRPAPQAARLSHPYIRVGWSPHPSFASLKFQKPRKKREGGREAKPYRIFEPATAGNQNSSSRIYK